MNNQRSTIDMLLDGVEWKPVEGAAPNDDGIPYATHTGQLTIGVGECVLDVVMLNTGMRLVTEESMERFFGFLSGEEE